MDAPVFEIGDRVMAVNRYPGVRLYSGIRPGDTGTVVAVDGDNLVGWDYGVDWDDLTDGHSCSGAARDGHGYWVGAEHIALADEGKPEFAPPTTEELRGFLAASSGGDR